MGLRVDISATRLEIHCWLICLNLHHKPYNWKCNEWESFCKKRAENLWLSCSFCASLLFPGEPPIRRLARACSKARFQLRGQPVDTAKYTISAITLRSLQRKYKVLAGKIVEDTVSGLCIIIAYPSFGREKCDTWCCALHRTRINA